MLNANQPRRKRLSAYFPLLLRLVRDQPRIGGHLDAYHIRKFSFLCPPRLMKVWTLLPCLTTTHWILKWRPLTKLAVKLFFKSCAGTDQDEVNQGDAGLTTSVDHTLSSWPVPSCGKSADQADQVDPRDPEFTMPLSSWAPEFSEQFPLAAKPRLVKVEAWQSFDQCAVDIFTSGYFQKQVFSKADIFKGRSLAVLWPVCSGYFHKRIFSKADIFKSGYFQKRIFSKVDILNNDFFHKERQLRKLRLELPRTGVRTMVQNVWYMC